MKYAFALAALLVASPALADEVLVSGEGVYGPIDYKYALLQKSNNDVWAKVNAHVNGIDNSGSTKRPVDYSYKTSALNPQYETVDIDGFHTFGPKGINGAIKTHHTFDNPFFRGGGAVARGGGNGKVK